MTPLPFSHPTRHPESSWPQVKAQGVSQAGTALTLVLGRISVEAPPHPSAVADPAEVPTPAWCCCSASCWFRSGTFRQVQGKKGSWDMACSGRRLSGAWPPWVWFPGAFLHCPGELHPCKGSGLLGGRRWTQSLCSFTDGSVYSLIRSLT